MSHLLKVEVPVLYRSEEPELHYVTVLGEVWSEDDDGRPWVNIVRVADAESGDRFWTDILPADWREAIEQALLKAAGHG